jgi:hypothetical protein
MKACVAALLATLCLACGTSGPAQTRRALLIGINTYQPAGTQAEHPAGCTYGRCEMGYFENLDGAVNDVQSMADVLTSPKFGFHADNVVLLTNPAPAQPRPGVTVLPAAQTTHDGILAAMQKYLVDLPHRGDTVVFYDASHGSLRVNSKGTKLTTEVNGELVHVDSTLVPSDAYKGGFDVRDREMTRIFNAALDKGIHLTVIFDDCHSGGISRGIGPKYRKRSLPVDPRDIAEAPELLSNGQPPPVPTERKDNPALVFSAVQQDQSANEIPAAGPGDEAHGAFTSALVEALQVMPANTPASVLFQRVRAVLDAGNVPDQDPELDTTAARRQQPLFGGTAADSGKVRAAAIRSADAGRVWLDIGRVSGIGVGSEFTASIPNSKGQTVQLRISSLEGIARSAAEVVSPANADVAAGEVFELTKWVPAESAPLLVWRWPANLSQDEILAAAVQVKAAGVTIVSDPADQPWTHVLSWNGANWLLEPAGAPSPITLQAPLQAAALKQNLSEGAKLWVNLPPSRELAAKLEPGEHSAVRSTSDLATAHYALTGVLTANGPAYAWYHKSELVSGPPTAASSNHAPGCSATSPYPVRTDWVTTGDSDAGAKLSHLASLLAKVHGWLELADSPADVSTSNYYSLALVSASNATPLPAGQPAREGDTLRMILEANAPVVEKRWVYILDIDCHGKGQLIYPLNYAENRFPNDAVTSNAYPLPGGGLLTVGKPLGVDTMIMLSTVQPLSDPAALNFEGVATRGAAGLGSPLDQLLSQTSAGTRGGPVAVPTNWGIGLTTLRSIPKDAPP